MELATLLTALAALCAAGLATLYSKSSVAMVRSSSPQQLITVVQDLRERVLASESILESYSAKMTSWRAEMEGVLEGVEGALERVERKRRSISSSESRAKAREEAPANLGDDPASLLARARAQGLMG